MSKINRESVYFLSTPCTIARLDISASIKQVAASIFTRTFLRDRPGFVFMPHAYMADDWGLANESITKGVKWLIDNEYIQMKRTRNGNLIKWIGQTMDDMPDDDSESVAAMIQESGITKFVNQESRNSGIGNHDFPVVNHEIRESRITKSVNALPILNTPILNTRLEAGGQRACVREDGQELEPVLEIAGTEHQAELPKIPSRPLLSERLTGLISMTFPSEPTKVLHQMQVSGWNERRVEAALLKHDPGKSVNYFFGICRNLTDSEVSKILDKPAEKTAADRIVTKDGKKVLKNGEWLDVASPYPNLPAVHQPTRFAAKEPEKLSSGFNQVLCRYVEKWQGSGVRTMTDLYRGLTNKWNTESRELDQKLASGSIGIGDHTSGINLILKQIDDHQKERLN